MKLSWTSLKISIAGAKLSHLVQKDKIWDHGSMTEQARIIFYLVQKARVSGSIESLRKQCTVSCLEKLEYEFRNEDTEKNALLMNPMIKELAITHVQPGKNNRPDMFCALLKGVSKDDTSKTFTSQWFFVRQGDWWLLADIKG